MERYGTLLFLLFSSFLDIRKREISIPVTLLFGLAGVVYSVRTGRTMTDYLIPLDIGILILGGSVLTRGQVGMGDGWMLLALGCMLRMECYIQMACIGMLLAAAYSGVLMLVFRKNRKTEIPLVPFLLLGYVGGMII
ncbi:prepilin peptidase [Blautia glucerasea]|uniref:prepilin peptidase n=1 Tax=Blautia glucerasea TaxID=536633 RepID=UPI001D081F3B|nr:prepilin peptidase [Blautia glucerasea]MCB6544478.1 prepilin peptidase [Blautia glucerasea]